MIVCLNGAFIEAGAHLDTADRGFLLGDGAFETLYVENGRAAFLSAHLARLRAGLSVLRIPAPDGLDDIAATTAELARRNGLDMARAAARVTVSRGSGARGLAMPGAAAPTMLVSVSPAPERVSPVSLHVSARRRFAGASTVSFKAVGAYAENILALDDARRAGADDAILLNEFGRAVSASSANLFAIGSDGVVTTPTVSEGALPGVVRALLVSGGHGVAIIQQPVPVSALSGALILLTNSLGGPVPARLAGAPASGRPAQQAIFQTLRTWYQERLEEDLKACRA